MTTSRARPRSRPSTARRRPGRPRSGPRRRPAAGPARCRAARVEGHGHAPRPARPGRRRRSTSCWPPASRPGPRARRRAPGDRRGAPPPAGAARRSWSLAPADEGSGVVRMVVDRRGQVHAGKVASPAELHRPGADSTPAGGARPAVPLWTMDWSRCREHPDRVASGRPTLEVRDLSRGSATRGPDGVPFDARPGEVIALLGPNGAGKTTTVRLLNGVLEPDRGPPGCSGFDLVTEGTRCAGARACSPRPPGSTTA